VFLPSTGINELAGFAEQGMTSVPYRLVMCWHGVLLRAVFNAGILSVILARATCALPVLNRAGGQSIEGQEDDHVIRFFAEIRIGTSAAIRGRQ
jgi:hypothetical protein